ncbi:MAG TPA: hypothetical protein O0X70_02970 [Methanocorpusculum sp.]|nr:hypothetical protein [Methanocorpusculum sp.]
MDKTGLVTFILGILFLIGGGFLIWFWLPEFIAFFMGGVGIVLALIGLAAVVLGVLMIKE